MPDSSNCSRAGFRRILVGSGAVHAHHGEEAGIVLRGKLELWVDGKVFLLEAGDSFGFPSTLAHRYRNPDTEEAEVIWAITPPSY